MIWTVLRAAAPRKQLILAAVLVSAAAELAALALTGTAVWLIARAAERPTIAALGVAIVGVRAFALSRGALRYGERLLSHDTALHALVRLRTRVYQALAEDGAPQLRDADLQARLVSDVDVVQDLLLRCVMPALTALATLLVAVAFCWAVLPAAGVALAVGALLAGLVVPSVAGVLAAQALRQVAVARTALAVETLDLLAGAADLAAAGAAGVALVRAAHAAADVERLERSAASAGPAAVVLAIQGFTTAVVAALVSRAHLPAVWLPVLTLVALASFEIIKPLVPAARGLVQARTAAARLTDLLRSSPAERDADVALAAGAREDAGVGLAGGRVWEVEGARVRYRVGGSPVIDGVSMRLEPGRSVALVGASGSGKSTLLALLSGTVEAEQGRVTLDGVDVRRYPAEEVSRQIAGLFQDAHVFAASVAANLRLAAPDADDERLRDAARRARLLDWIEGLPNGWDTLLGDDGALMSGGQRKRLLLARALLADRPLLLLDEPTEGLDPETADEVMADVLAAYGGRALCVATHRLAGLETFDEILVLDEGRIVERGTHRDLMARAGFYRSLWSEAMTVGLPR